MGACILQIENVAFVFIVTTEPAHKAISTFTSVASGGDKTCRSVLAGVISTSAVKLTVVAADTVGALALCTLAPAAV